MSEAATAVARRARRGAATSSADVARLVIAVRGPRARGARRSGRDDALAELRASAPAPAAVVGITGTPGSGKSSLLSRGR